MTVTAKMLSKKGSVLAFNRNGEEIIAQFFPKAKAWKVMFGASAAISMIDPRTQSFAAASDAAAYITENADQAKTTELKWWN